MTEDVPKPTQPPAYTHRVTATTIVSRVHQGRGTHPRRLCQDALAVQEFLRSGTVPAEPEHTRLLREAFASAQGGLITVPEAPKPRRWWHDRWAVAGYAAIPIGLLGTWGLLLLAIHR